jgi:hypothetical protein
MVIFLVALAISAACARFRSLIVARFRRAMFFWGLVLSTEVALIVMVRIMAALSVVVVAIAAARLAIFGIIAALLVGVLGLVAMDVARFAGKLRRSLPLGLVAFVVTVAGYFVATIVIAIIAIIATVRGTAFVGHVPHLVVVPALSRASPSFIPFVVSLFELLLQLATALFDVVERFEVFRDGSDRLVDESSSGRDELIAF